MHPRNRYTEPYDLAALCNVVPALAEHIVTSPDGRKTLDFAAPVAVLQLNKALLLKDYGLDFWDLAPEVLCPGVPGRLDYVHVLADLIGERATDVRGVDIGTGASVVYPILGVGEYGWRFVGTEVDVRSLRAAEAIVKFNRVLRGRVELRQQHHPTSIFEGVLRPQDRFTFSMCNPPFYASPDEAAAFAKTKATNIGRTRAANNFGGRAHELVTPGGEEAFLHRMILESVAFKAQVGWFTMLVSREAYLPRAKRVLAKAKPSSIEVLPLDTGNKPQRVLAWRW